MVKLVHWLKYHTEKDLFNALETTALGLVRREVATLTFKSFVRS